MITFGTPTRTIQIRPEPDAYDLMVFDNKGARFLAYDDDHKIEPTYKCGWKYQIILYKKQIFGKGIKEIEGFAACLINPIFYAEAVMFNGFNGCIGKMSNKSIDTFAEMWQELLLKGSVDEYLNEIGS